MEKKYTKSDVNLAVFTAFAAGWAARDSKKFKTSVAAWEAIQKLAEQQKRRLVQKK